MTNQINELVVFYDTLVQRAARTAVRLDPPNNTVKIHASVVREPEKKVLWSCKINGETIEGEFRMTSLTQLGAEKAWDHVKLAITDRVVRMIMEPVCKELGELE